MPSFDPDRIRRDLAELKTLKPAFGVAHVNNAELYPCLSEDEVAAFEDEHGIRLPEDYRTFITQLGNGGAGPAYGVFKLGEINYGSNPRPWADEEGLVGVLSEPFPHREAWNDLTLLPPHDLDEETYDKKYAEFEKVYMDSKWVNGAIPICHEGCGYLGWLVVTGAEAGHIWFDNRAAECGICPAADPTPTFGQWYSKWLAGQIRLSHKYERRASSKEGAASLDGPQ